MPEPRPSQSKSALEPTLTAFDKRVLKALPPWPATFEENVTLMSAWEVAEQIRAYDVGTVLGTLRGLERFHYVWSKGWGHGQRFCANWRAAEVFSS